MKAGIMLSDLSSRQHRQGDLFAVMMQKSDYNPLMETLDEINRKMGNSTVRYGAEGFAGRWQMKQNKKSPNYTTRWNELAVVR